MTERTLENEVVERTRRLMRAISRRDLMRGAMAAGTGLALAGRLPSRSAAAQDDTPTPGGTLLVGVTGQPDTMDPHKATIYTSLQVYDNIFSKLINIDPELNFIPGLASSWTNPSPTEYQFELVQNAVFHNGEKFTAADVKYTFDRIKDPETASPAATVFESLQSVEVLGDYSVKFTLSEPFGPFLAAMAGGSQIVNQKAIEAADPARNPVGTGPFKFVEWVADDHVTLERWDQYFKEGKPYLDKIVFRGLPVDDTRMAALQGGEVNWVDAIPLQKVASISSGDEYNYYTAPVAGLPDFLVMNCSKPPFDNIKLRQAVAWATDRKAILQLAYSGVGEVANEEMASGSAWNTGLTTYDAAPDIEKAKGLLAESGFDTSQSITYLGLPQYPELLRTGEILKDNLEKIGLKMEIEQQEVTVWGQNLFGKNYEITSAYAATMLDPDDFYHGVLYSTAGFNYVGYANPDLDALADAGRTETDFEKRKAIYKQARELVNTEVPITFVHYELLNYATAKDVQGTQIYPSMELRFEDVWIKQS